MKKLVYLAAILFVGCNSKTETNQANLSQQLDSISPKSFKNHNVMVGGILQSIPSPIETSSLIKNEGGLYDNSILNRKLDEHKYPSNFEKALVLGIYGTDLGYVNIYNQNQDALSYLDPIHALAEELKIEQFFDYDTFKRLASKSENVDSLLFLTVSNYEKMNTYLQQQKREEHSALILTGGWLEALYISCKVAETNKSKLLEEKIGEQKIVLDQILVLLAQHEQDNNVSQLTKKLATLKLVFNEVQYEQTFHASNKNEENGVYLVKGQSESKITISADQIEKIGEITKSIRDGILI